MHRYSPERQEKILKIHHFLPGRSVVLKSTSNTRGQGWTSGAVNHLIGEKGTVLEVHENVLEAVKINLKDSGDERFWHHSDLELIVPEEKTVDPVMFDPCVLDV